MAAKPILHAPQLRDLSRPPAKSSAINGSDVGMAGISLLLLAIAGCGLLVMATRFERGRFGG